MTELFGVDWTVSEVHLRLIEPTTDELQSHASALAGFYNEPYNRALLTNEHEFEAQDVVVQFAEMREDGGRAFLLFADGAMMGDCDLRHFEGTTAELAILVGARARQAKGFGTRFTTMLLALAFERLGRETVYASVRPENTGSLRMLQKVGYVVDTTPAARRYAEAEDDVCLSVEARAFTSAHRHAIDGMRFSSRRE